MKRIRPYIVFASIAILAVFLRFDKLGTVPPSPDWDEAALGYNAYSILKTGRDEYGKFLPLELRSYDDYKPPLYAYLTIPSVALFGLNVWSVRLPSAVAGSVAVIGTYLLVYELLFAASGISGARKKKRWEGLDTWDIHTGTALISMFLLAISPWHLQFSRIAFEANTGITLNILGLTAFFLGLTGIPWMAASAFFFALSLYAYHSERVFVPLLVAALAVIFRRELFRDWKKVGVGMAVGVLVALPLLPVVTDKTAMTRLKGTSPLSDQTALLSRTVRKLEADKGKNDTLGVILDNRRVVYAKTLIDGYISHFSLEWLFLTGDSNRHHAPDNGLMYLWELPFFFWGMTWIWKKGGTLRSLLFAWLFIAPVAASPTGGTPHAIRTLVFLPAAQIFTATGLVEWAKRMYPLWTGKKAAIPVLAARVGTAAYACLAVFISLFYFHMYYRQLDREYSRDWQYGYAQAVRYAEEHKGKFKQVVVSTALEQPHMFFLFYTKYDPAAYLAQGGTASGGFKEYRNRFDKYVFRAIGDWQKEPHDGKTLYIGTPREIPNGAQYSIYYLDGSEAIRIGQ